MHILNTSTPTSEQLPASSTEDEETPDCDVPVGRILIVAPSIRIMGGQAVNAMQLLRDFERSGIEASFQPINPSLPGPLAYAERVKYVRTAFVSLFYIAGLFRSVPSHDIIHIFSASYFSFVISQAPAILVARLFGKKVVLNYRSGECDDHLRKWRWLMYPVLRRIDQIVVPSQYLVETLAQHGFNAIAISNVVDTSQFPFVTRSKPRRRILVPRMLEPLYNVECSLRAYEIVKREFPDVSLTVLGYGSQEAELKQFVADRDLQDVDFLGRVDRNQIADVYADHDILLNSSSVDNMPTSILEAFATGLPVVTTAAGGIPYIVEDGETGHLAPVNDHEALARRLLQVMRQPAATEQMILRAREKSAQFTWPVVEAQWRRMYADLFETANNLPNT